MSDEIRKRAACDRCHTQKVRCPKRENQDICDRCSKMQAECVFSPFRPKKLSQESRGSLHGKTLDEPSASQTEARLKRRRTDPQAQTQLDNDPEPDAAVAVPASCTSPVNDWTSAQFRLPDNFEIDAELAHLDFSNMEMPFDFGDMEQEPNHEGQSPPSTDQLNPSQLRKVTNLQRSFKHSHQLLVEVDENLSAENPDYSSSGSTSSDTIWATPRQQVDPDPTTHCVKKLSQLSLELFEHSKTVPPMSIHDPLAPGNLADHPVPEVATNYVLEDTLRLTQEMIDLYPKFLAALSGQRPSGISSAGVLCFDPHSTNEPIDYASILLIISCHLRLISIYEVLFQHMHHCFDSKGVDTLPQQARLTAPQLKIGSYIPPSSATIPLQMLLLIQFASQLYIYAADLAAEIPALSTSMGSNTSSSSSLGTADDQTMLLTKAAADNVKDKAQMMSQTIGDFRGRILASGLLA